MSTVIENLLSRLHKVKKSGKGYIACCPSHPDRSPSLSITPDGETVLIHCFAGCGAEDVLASIGLTLSDLYPPRDTPYRKAGKPLFPASQALQIICDDALVVCVCAAAVGNGNVLSETDRARLIEAGSRIGRALSAAGVRHG